MIRCPWMMPLGRRGFPFTIGRPNTVRPCSTLRSIGRFRRSGASSNTRSQSTWAATSRSSSVDSPAAYNPPTTLPMLVPATASTRIPASSSTWITPTWANPRAEPPLRARPMRGRLASSEVADVESGCWDFADGARSSSAPAAAAASGVMRFMEPLREIRVEEQAPLPTSSRPGSRGSVVAAGGSPGARPPGAGTSESRPLRSPGRHPRAHPGHPDPPE